MEALKFIVKIVLIRGRQSRPLFAYFRPFLITVSILQIEKSIDGVLGIQTHGRMKVSADDTTELWRPPIVKIVSHYWPQNIVVVVNLRLRFDFFLAMTDKSSSVASSALEFDLNDGDSDAKDEAVDDVAVVADAGSDDAKDDADDDDDVDDVAVVATANAMTMTVKLILNRLRIISKAARIKVNCHFVRVEVNILPPK